MKYVAIPLCVLLGCCFSAGALTGTGDSEVGVLDTLGPEISGLQVSQPVASSGDIVTLTFSLSEALSGLPTVTVNGAAADFVGESGGEYTYTYEVGSFDFGGPAELYISGADAFGNTGNLTNSSILTFDLPALPLRAWSVIAVLVLLGIYAMRRMRKIAAVLFLALLCAALAALGQAPVVSNVSFVQQPRDSGGTEVIITYDLESESCCCDVTVSLSKDAGEDGFTYPAASITGDTTGVQPGTGKQIVWDVAADFPGEYIPQAQLRVTAETRPCDLSPWTRFDPWHIFAYSAGCQNNLKQMGLVFRMFTNESAGERYPRLSNEPGRLMMRKDEVYPEFVHDPEILTCPGKAPETPMPCFDDRDYVYLGYLVSNDQDVLAFANAYTAEIAAGGDFSNDLPGETSYGHTIYRLREGIARFLIVDINDTEKYYAIMRGIPVMFDWPDNHQEGWGGNVLFMDGHVEFVHYPGQFPMTETTISTLAELANYEPPVQWSNPDLVSPYPRRKDVNGFVSSCANNLKQVGISLKMSANETAGQLLPPLSPVSGRLMMDDAIFYPNFLKNPDWVTCPGQPELSPVPFFEDQHYAYLGYAVLNDADVSALVTAYESAIASGGDFTSDLPVATSYGDSLLRLREGISSSLITNPIDPAGCASPQSIPVMLEWPDNHEDLPGGNVLYLDGHVEWKNYPGEFPMTEATITALAALANHSPATAWAEPNPVYTLAYDPYDFVDTCRSRIRNAAYACSFFGLDSTGDVWPKLSSEPGRLMYTQEEVNPRYLSNPGHLVCPGPAPVTPEPLFDDTHYIYFGYLMMNDADVQAFASAYAAEIANGGDFSGDLLVTTSYGTRLWRLRENIQRYFITDINNPYIPPDEYIGDHEIPVLMEWPGQHEGLSGGHVVYKDGHAEWHDFPGRFPMTANAVATFAALAHWNPTTAWATKAYTRYNDPHLQALCESNLYQMGIALDTFESHHREYPRLSTVPGTLMFRAEGLYPYHLFDLRRVNCPGSTNACLGPTLDDHSYAYWGYVLLTDEDMETFANAYGAELSSGGDFSEDLPEPVSYGDTIKRFDSGYVRFLITDTNPPEDYIPRYTVPMLIEWPDNHGDIRGGNVLYMDGHVEWLDYPSKFPMTEATMNVLTGLAGRPPIE
ncbi:MAG: hypothetical protein IT365_22350 [Candidatus Hydrogenedentes bacterium]|nr:hypothetical protein [Candidatus Hydrogenedentota bacterium]